jgi:sarcosine oxidase
VAVVGAGIVGLSTAYALAEAGATVRVFERGVPGNGQSGGQSRVFRHAHDDPRMVAMAVESRGIYRAWEQRFGVELVSSDGVVALGPGVHDRLRAMAGVEGAEAHLIEPAEVAERQPLLAPYEGDAMLDAGGGSIRTTAAIEALAGALGDALVVDEVLSVRPEGDGVEVRAGGHTEHFDHAVVCAGRFTAALAHTVGLALPVEAAAHVRLTFAVVGDVPGRLACLQDSSDRWGEAGIYAAAVPGNTAYAVGLSQTTEAGEDGRLPEPGELAELAARAAAYVERALPGLAPEPVDVRHCWVTELPWSSDAVAAWTVDDRVTFVAGHNLYKQAPGLGRALAGPALGRGLREELRPEARLGSAP